MNEKKQITIFTPTYNRVNLLPQLYESLKRQTNKNFIWLIIDDGSTDNTKEVVTNWIKENLIEIQYIYKENGGKHTTIELSNKECKTEYICCCDSDDFLSDDAVEVVYRYIKKYGNDPEIVGFVGRNADYNKRPINENWPKEIEKICFYNLIEKYKQNDTILIFKTDIIKNYHFPNFEGEKFVTESVFYKQFLYKYKMITIKEYIHLIEYQQDGYSNQGMNLFFNNPKGFLFSKKVDAYYEIKYGKNIKNKLKKSTLYYLYKSVFNFKEDFSKEIKIKFPYNMLGNLSKIPFINRIKKQYKAFLIQKNKNK